MSLQDRFKRSSLDWSPSGHIPGMPIWPQFVDAYLEAALWAASDSEGDNLDEQFSIHDFSQKAIDEAVSDSNKFIGANLKDLEQSGGDHSQHGHDFWLTRNGHGTGFWDRGYKKSVGNRLTAASEKFSERRVIVNHGHLEFDAG